MPKAVTKVTKFSSSLAKAQVQLITSVTIQYWSLLTKSWQWKWASRHNTAPKAAELNLTIAKFIYSGVSLPAKHPVGLIRIQLKFFPNSIIYISWHAGLCHYAKKLSLLGLGAIFILLCCNISHRQPNNSCAVYFKRRVIHFVLRDIHILPFKSNETYPSPTRALHIKFRFHNCTTECIIYKGWWVFARAEPIFV